jgi:hypothetical protein
MIQDKGREVNLSKLKIKLRNISFLFLSIEGKKMPSDCLSYADMLGYCKVIMP